MTIELDLPRLAAWLAEQQLIGSESINVTRLSGGQSNPTFFIDGGSRRFVLRKQPTGQLLAGAHAVDREYRVMQALRDTDVPVPRMHAFCADTGILGTPFFIMDFLDGRVLMDQALAGMTPGERFAIYSEMNRVMAALHSVDVAALGLADFGRSGNYVARQIARWSRQCRESTLPVSDAMQRLMDWLPEHIPPDEETTLVHGDYRMDNLVFHAVESRVIGVLDWELSTLGDPLADFSYHCMSWRIPPRVWRGIGGLDLAMLGIPDEASYIRRYADATGREVAAHWEFYMAYNLFRMAAILHGIAQRAVDGIAASGDAPETGSKAVPIAELGWQCAQRQQAVTR